jgi:predicted DNA-binding protein
MCLRHEVDHRDSRILKEMEVHFPPEMERRINDLAAQSGRGTDELVLDAMAGYLVELGQTRETLNSRYDDLKSGKVKLIDGEEFFERLRRREEELLKKPSPQ